MNILRHIFGFIFGHPSPPPPPPPPADARTLSAARDDALEAIATLRQRLLDERRRREETRHRRLDAETTGNVPPESNARYSVAASPSVEWLRSSLEADLRTLDPRAFAKRLLQGVREIYAGNPVPFYTAAGLSRSAYSKIISHPDRHPAKDTVLAMAAALKMNLAEAESFLALAGYSISSSIPADIVWRACFSHAVHHLPQIRALLDEFVLRPPSSSH